MTSRGSPKADPHYKERSVDEGTMLAIGRALIVFLGLS